MQSEIRVSELPVFDMSAHLGSDADAAEYLSQVLEDGDTDELLRVLGYIARAKGMAVIAERAGLGLESLVNALAPGAKPRYDTITRIINALDVNFEIRHQGGGLGEDEWLALETLRSGADKDSALVLLKYLQRQLLTGETPDLSVVNSYLLPALDRIIKSDNPTEEVAKAFGFKGGRGGYRRGSNFERDWLLAVHAELRYREIRQDQDNPDYQKDRGATAEDLAFEQVSRQFEASGWAYVSPSTVRDAHRKHRDSTAENPFGVRDMHTDELRELVL